MKYYKQLDKALKSYEEFRPYHQYNIDWICDRITWCWKWKKITPAQMEELALRATTVLEGMRYEI